MRFAFLASLVSRQSEDPKCDKISSVLHGTMGPCLRISSSDMAVFLGQGGLMKPVFSVLQNI